MPGKGNHLMCTHKYHYQYLSSVNRNTIWIDQKNVLLVTTRTKTNLTTATPSRLQITASVQLYRH